MMTWRTAGSFFQLVLLFLISSATTLQKSSSNPYHVTSEGLNKRGQRELFYCTEAEQMLCDVIMLEEVVRELLQFKSKGEEFDPLLDVQ